MQSVIRVPHDAFLRDVQLDWEHGLLTIRFGFEEWDLALTATGVRKLQIRRDEPWGPSSYVNETHGPVQISGGLMTFSIEMQSGDAIELTAVDIRFERTRALAPD
jgi:hypothetical protein